MGFKPSALAQDLEFDLEAAVSEEYRGPSPVGSIGERAIAYKTEVELAESVSPFLAANIEKDRGRRNYSIKSGGALLFHGDDPQDELVDMHEENVQFGHEQSPGAGQSSGRSFSVRED